MYTLEISSITDWLGVIVVGAVALAYLMGWCRIFENAGHSGWLGWLMIVPIVNLILFLWFAYFSRWPVWTELGVMREKLRKAQLAIGRS